jgi:hypothetical protein
MRASATAEGGARLTVSIMAGEVALDGRGGMISGTKAKLTPLCRRNRRLRPQKNPHYSGMGWVWSLNLRIQVYVTRQGTLGIAKCWPYEIFTCTIKQQYYYLRHVAKFLKTT